MKKPMRTRWVASRPFIAIDPSGRQRPVVLRIGQPYKVSKDEWACRVAGDGIQRGLQDIHGGDALQALCLGISLIRILVENFLKSGGKLLEPGERTEWSRTELATVFGRVGKGSGR
jgi:hypothetical protein